MRRLELPTPADMSVSALGWASTLLDEPPTELHTSTIGASIAAVCALAVTDFDVRVVVDDSLREGEWVLRGATREVHSEGV